MSLVTFVARHDRTLAASPDVHQYSSGPDCGADQPTARHRGCSPPSSARDVGLEQRRWPAGDARGRFHAGWGGAAARALLASEHRGRARLASQGAEFAPASTGVPLAQQASDLAASTAESMDPAG